jgi:hypothetical protein
MMFPDVLSWVPGLFPITIAEFGCGSQCSESPVCLCTNNLRPRGNIEATGNKGTVGTYLEMSELAVERVGTRHGTATPTKLGSVKNFV